MVVWREEGRPLGISIVGGQGRSLVHNNPEGGGGGLASYVDYRCQIVARDVARAQL